MTDLACPGVGQNAKRSCTDKLCTLIFVIFNMALIALLIFAVAEGDIRKITHGVDYNGNVCGVGEPEGLTISAADWKSREYLWFPFGYDSSTQTFRIVSALKYGICVSDCNPGATVSNYGGPYGQTPETFDVKFTATDQFYRCVPNFNSFVCPVGDALCPEAARKAADDIMGDMHLDTFLFTFVKQIYSNLWITALFLLATVVLCFIWIILMRRLVKPCVIGVLILSFLVGAGCVIALWYHFHTCWSDERHGSDEMYITLVFAIITSALLFVYLCVLLFLRKSIMMSCDIIEEGTRIIADIPQIIVVPIVTSVLLFGFLVLFGTIAVYLFTHGTLRVTEDNYELAFGASVTLASVEYDRPMYANVFQGYNLFMVLWLMGFQNAVAYLVMALAGVYWFFSAPGDDKSVSSPICSGVAVAYRYHVGTLAFGSLLMAIIAFARLMLTLLEKRLRAMGDKASVLCCLCICCAKCCLACLERIVKFITENGYVVTAITGKSLIPAASEGLTLIMSTPAVLTINAISGIVITIGQWLIVLLITLCGALSYNSYTDDWGANVVACVVMLFIGAWYITGTFADVLKVCIDTTLLCFCYDQRYHNGADRPYYSPNDLIQYMANRPKPKQQQNTANTAGVVPSDGMLLPSSNNAHMYSSTHQQPVPYGAEANQPKKGYGYGRSDNMSA